MAAEVVYVDGIDAAFPPFSFIDEKGQPAGFDVDVIRWIADEMGFEVKIIPIDWDAIIPMLIAGNINLIASGMTITAARQEQVAFTSPYWTIDLAVVVRETKDAEGEPVPELTLFSAVQTGRKIGVQRGTTSQDWLEENVIGAGIDVQLVLYENFLLALEDVLIGRIDAAVMDEPTARSGIVDRPLTIVGTIKTGEIYGYAVRKQDAELLALLNEGLRRIQASDAWDRLVDTWLVGN
ncbi:MAG: transporter substrate-binding domain-containing protein [Candidatus Bipolaricaulis sp.]|nr:transporter substrate-binding domain-containing protein [Candidatus Bipolaricaulis sp.]